MLNNNLIGFEDIHYTQYQRLKNLNAHSNKINEIKFRKNKFLFETNQQIENNETTRESYKLRNKHKSSFNDPSKNNIYFIF